MSANSYSGINFSYAIDSQHRFVMLSEGMLELYPRLHVGDVCHKALYGIDAPCPQCPLLESRTKEIAVYNPDISRWVTVICVDIEWPGSGTCSLIVCNAKEDRPRKGAVKESDANQDEEALVAERLLVADIHNAVRNGEFEPYFQPKCIVSTREIIGAEVLARWESPTRGEVSPGQFIPVLEASGNIVELDRSMWRKTFSLVRQWLDEGVGVPPISVNVSRSDIAALDVAAELSSLAEEFAVDPFRFEVEVTETVLSDDKDALGAALERLRAAGFVVAIDDFGSGYSSLNMLKDLSVDILKLDLKFLDFTEANYSRAIAIMRSVLEMSRALGIPVVVEGVEHRRQALVLGELGCSYCQGFYYYDPLSAEGFRDLLEEGDVVVGGVMSHSGATERRNSVLRDSEFDEVVLNTLMTPMALYELVGEDISIRRFNEPFIRVVGEGELLRRKERIQQYMHPDDLEKVYAAMRFAARFPRETGRCHVRFLAESGEYRPFSITFNLASVDGDTYHFFGLPLVDDPNEHRNAPLFTMMTRDFLRGAVDGIGMNETVIDNIIGALALYRLEEGNLYLRGCNQALLDIFGMMEEDLGPASTRSVLPHTSEGDVSNVLALFNEALISGERGAHGVCGFYSPRLGAAVRCHLDVFLLREHGNGYEFVASVREDARLFEGK